MKLAHSVLAGIIFSAFTVQSQTDTNQVKLAKKKPVEPRSEKCKVENKHHADNLLKTKEPPPPRQFVRHNCPGCGRG